MRNHLFHGQIDSCQVLRAKSGGFMAYKRNDASICRIVHPPGQSAVKCIIRETC